MLCAVFAVVMVAEQVSASGTKLFTTVLPILRGWLDDAAASHDALGQLLAGNPAIGAPPPSRHTLHVTPVFPSHQHVLPGAISCQLTLVLCRVFSSWKLTCALGS